MKKRRNLGITLIVLVITIVVLLILAGISLNLVLGENGIVTKAKDAREQTIIGHEKEQINLAYSACKTRENFDDLVTASELETEMKKSNENVSVAADGDNLVITFEETKHQYNIGQDGSFSDIVDWSKLGPGLYKTGTSEMIKSWQELIDDGEVTVKDGVLDTDRIKIEEKGDLVISSSVNEIISFYKGCGGSSDYNVIGLYIPKSVNSIGDFAGEKFLALEKLVISDGCKSIGDYAFRMVYYNVESKLSTIEIPDSIEKIGFGAFEDTKWLKEQPDGEVYLGKVFYEYKGKNAKNASVEIKDGTKGIASAAFNGCRAMESIVLPNTLKNIGEGAFEYCRDLIKIDIPNNIENIERITFLGCTNLKTINIPDNVNIIKESAFSECKNLTTVNISEGVERIERYAFSECTSFETIDIPASISEMDMRAFNKCYKLTKVNVAEKNNSYSSSDGILFDKNKTKLLLYRIKDASEYDIPDTVITIGNNAFDSCYELTAINIPESTIEIGEEAFANCGGIKEIKIPENVKIINKKAFYHCYSLKNFVIPEGVTTIGDNVFERCGSLESINIPASVTELGKDSFRSCTKVKVTVASGTSITASDLSKAGLSSSQYTFE